MFFKRKVIQKQFHCVEPAYLPTSAIFVCTLRSLPVDRALKLGFFSFLIPQLNILLWVQPARPSSLYYGRNLLNLVDQSMKLYGLGKTIRRKIRLTFQQLLSSYVLVSRDVIPIGPTQQEEHSIPGKKVDHQCGRFSSRTRFWNRKGLPYWLSAAKEVVPDTD